MPRLTHPSSPGPLPPRGGLALLALLAAAVALPAAAPAQVVSVAGAGPAAQQALRYGTGVWEPDSLGNHRAVVRVDSGGEALWVRIPWRRRDASPEKVAVIVMDARTRLRVHNVARLDVNRDFGDLVFQAPTVPGDYYFYYLPYTGTFRSNYPKITYRPPDDRPDPGWMQRNGLAPQVARLQQWKSLPQATVTGFDAIDDFSRFTAMEYVATKGELDAMKQKYAWAEFFAFPEDRARSIRMRDDVPFTWVQDGPFKPFVGTAARGEYYTFQVGLWAHRLAIDSLRYEATPFTRKGGREVIPASAFTCFNLEGVDWSGRRFTRAPRVERGKVQPLWFGVQVPRDAVPGDYEGEVAIGSSNAKDRALRVTIRVGADSVVNRGDDDPQRLTRLRWLNSQLAADDGIVPPYTPMTVAGTPATGATIGVLGRTMSIGGDGFPTAIRSTFTNGNTAVGGPPREVLAAPLQLVVRDSAGRPLAFRGAPATIVKRAPGAVAWRGERTAGALRLAVRAQMEFEGTTEYAVTLRATERTAIGDVRLELPMRAEAATYMMGLGQKGGRRPEAFRWSWDVATKNQDAVWLGGVSAGLQLTLTDEHYVRPLNTNFYLSKPLVLPRSWGNGGKGGCDIAPAPRPAAARGAPAPVHLSCYSGARVLEPGDSLRFDFRLMITPFKPLDVAGQWATRFFHAFVPVDSVARRGANTINVHHANRVNPWINYPFLEPAPMRAYIDSAHARGMKVKIYYTVRELTNRAPELFALRSLGDEVLSAGPGGGYSWLQEHLGGDYLAAWHVPDIKDAAVVNSGVSRWHNFYVEGLDWLVRHVGIDGLYIDDVAFDRTTMKRVRKVLDRGNPGALIDLHSANQYNPRDGFASSANLYLEHFPFLNRLWFGEYFDYDAPADYWLVEVSGIPFGLMGEMLEKGGNPWRGMTMGMTARLPWSGDPAPLWKVWDDFGIQRAAMTGWWSERSPVATGDSLVLATTWRRPGRAMVSLGSWRDADTRVTLRIDWKALGLDPTRTVIRAPAIEKFQGAGTWKPGDAITVPAKKGLMLLLEGR
ncbi:MAG TPA: glycoside hydrolase domain-containing protein [Gemmatimonadaceae bacterium]|nr:glycoside hydrolase domain-containing protein [Gemmatimonadaceae bacterium]